MKRALICAAFALSVTVAAWAQQPGAGAGAQPPAGRPGAGAQPGQPRPGTPGQPAVGANQFMRGSIISVDPTGNSITLRTGEGANIKEQMFRVNDTTKFFGADRAALNDGLRFNGWKPGTDVWFQAGTGANATILSNLSLSNPSVKAPGLNKDRDRDDLKRPDKDK